MSIFFSLVTKEPLKIKQSDLEFLELNGEELIDRDKNRVGMVFEPRSLSRHEKELFHDQYFYSTDFQDLTNTSKQTEIFNNELILITKKKKGILFDGGNEWVLYPEDYALNKAKEKERRVDVLKFTLFFKSDEFSSETVQEKLKEFIGFIKYSGLRVEKIDYMGDEYEFTIENALKCFVQAIETTKGISIVFIEGELPFIQASIVIKYNSGAIEFDMSFLREDKTISSIFVNLVNKIEPSYAFEYILNNHILSGKEVECDQKSEVGFGLFRVGFDGSDFMKVPTQDVLVHYLPKNLMTALNLNNRLLTEDKTLRIMGVEFHKIPRQYKLKVKKIKV